MAEAAASAEAEWDQDKIENAVFCGVFSNLLKYKRELFVGTPK